MRTWTFSEDLGPPGIGFDWPLTAHAAHPIIDHGYCILGIASTVSAGLTCIAIWRLQAGDKTLCEAPISQFCELAFSHALLSKTSARGSSIGLRLHSFLQETATGNPPTPCCPDPPTCFCHESLKICTSTIRGPPHQMSCPFNGTRPPHSHTKCRQSPAQTPSLHSESSYEVQSRGSGTRRLWWSRASQKGISAHH